MEQNTTKFCPSFHQSIFQTFKDSNVKNYYEILRQFEMLNHHMKMALEG